MDWRRSANVVLFLVMLISVSVFGVQTFPALAGADYALVVKSGSMNPAIQTGSMVFVKDAPAERVEEGDIITYRDDGGNLITHRVIEKQVGNESFSFTTKGDANENPDGDPIYRRDIVGIVAFDIPLMGYIALFGRTLPGYVSTVLIPGLILIFSGLQELSVAIETEGRIDE
jgi:signal peptidase